MFFVLLQPVKAKTQAKSTDINFFIHSHPFVKLWFVVVASAFVQESQQKEFSKFTNYIVYTMVEINDLLKLFKIYFS